MPKTLGTQGFSGLREEVVRFESRSSRSPVLQEITDLYKSTHFRGCSYFLCDERLFAIPERLPRKRRGSGGISMAMCQGRIARRAPQFSKR